MADLLADRSSAIMEGLALIAVSLGLVLASIARARVENAGRAIERVYWQDASQAGYAWAGATLLVLVGAFGNIEGLRAPIWSIGATTVGLVGLVIARLRWVRLASDVRGRGIDAQGRNEHTRLASTSWEVGLLGAGVGGLVVYGVTLPHGWGHPVHWLVAGVGLVIGYAIGLLVATPRYAVRRGRA